MRNPTPTPEQVQYAADLAYTIARHACDSIGPNGTVVRVAEEDAGMLRAAFIARLAEAATTLANGEEVSR